MDLRGGESAKVSVVSETSCTLQAEEEAERRFLKDIALSNAETEPW